MLSDAILTVAWDRLLAGIASREISSPVSQVSEFNNIERLPYWLVEATASIAKSGEE